MDLGILHFRIFVTELESRLIVLPTLQTVAQRVGTFVFDHVGVPQARGAPRLVRTMTFENQKNQNFAKNTTLRTGPK